MKYSCPVISRQTLLSDEGALSLATSGQRRMAVSTACLTQSTVVICPDRDNSDQSTLPPLTNTPDIPGINLNNHQHHKFFKALAHLEKHLMHLAYRLTSNVVLLACVILFVGDLLTAASAHERSTGVQPGLCCDVAVLPEGVAEGAERLHAPN